MLDMEVINEGTIDQVVVYPRRVIEGAFKHNARSMIFVHNHPSGDASPTYADFELTRKLVRAASAVDIRVHDHIIVGKDTYFSGKECGWLNGAYGCLCNPENTWVELHTNKDAAVHSAHQASALPGKRKRS